MMLPPRGRYLTTPPSKWKRHTSWSISADALPREIRQHTGHIKSARQMKQDGPAQVLLVEAEQGTFVLKVVEAAYRSQELRAEHKALLALHRAVYGASYRSPDPGIIGSMFLTQE